MPQVLSFTHPFISIALLNSYNQAGIKGNVLFTAPSKLPFQSKILLFRPLLSLLPLICPFVHSGRPADTNENIAPGIFFAIMLKYPFPIFVV